MAKNIMLVIAWLLSLVISALLGYFQRDIVEKVNTAIENSKKEPVEVGPTNPYHVVNENAVYNNTKKVGAVLPKTPQLLEFEEQQKIREMNEANI